MPSVRHPTALRAVWPLPNSARVAEFEARITNHDVAVPPRSERAPVGGDEFALVLGQDGALLQSGNEAHAIAARIVMILAEPFVVDGIAIQIGASVGIAIQDVPFMPVRDLMHRADVALSRAKLDGRRCVRTFKPDMDAEMRARVLLERDLRQALAQDAVVPHYQPLVDLRSGALVGFEMLAR
ncbi:diguanylate cyclase domain-containing protein [Lichenifustis flavocetrariae]|uniref:Diguanylate cyclase n=1 Tax=Lichenifustis flavocetrariae TaxID=2949735 RepID=A0AA41Z2R8_9HYPH|nr:diguanylate cyclase [Lichenifustis flavocetrariae]MCW6513161.1 diguanylate cyclase [Lichenifustis flavocetrariae]